MSMTLEQVKEAAMQLAPEEREILAEELFSSVSREERAEIDAAWSAEVGQRLSRFQNGDTSGSTVEESIQRVLRRHGK